MLVSIIKEYLRQHKRLVVPQLGAFLVKEPDGHVVFSELLRRDDGMLRGLMRAAGMNDLEAAGAIDRFVFEIRHAVQGGGEYRMEGLGRFRPGPNDTLAFTYEPQEVSETEPATEQSAKTDAKPSAETRAGAETASDPDARSAADKRQGARPPVSPILEPDPTLKGLRYGKPRRTTDAYTYVEPRVRRTADRFLLVAILAAVLALAAIAFGYYVSDSGEREAQPEQTELPASVPPTSVPAAASPADAASRPENTTQTPEE